MSTQAKMDEILREKLIAEPNFILEDQGLMRALIAANERAMGGNIVDLRGIAMERLEARLDRLEDTHRSVIAAAYENLAGTNQVHRAILRMLDPIEFEDFLRDLSGEVAEILRIECVRLVLETVQHEDTAVQDALGDVLITARPGFVNAHMNTNGTRSDRQVVLRQMSQGEATIYADRAEWFKSEALIRLDFGDKRLPGMLVLGSEDPHQFTPQQGTDLLAFFGGVFERSMRRWLA